MWSAEVQRHDKIYNDPLEVMMFKKWLGVSESESRREGRTGQARAATCSSLGDGFTSHA